MDRGGMAVQYKDYYKVLGVAKNASQDDIRKAFRKLAREHHPDVSKDKKGAEAKFKEINEANEVLGDPAKRQKYDELGSDWERGGYQQTAGGFPGGGADGFSDFFEAFFGGATRGGGGFGRGGGGGGRMPRSPFEARPPEPQDIETELEVRIEEALSGGKKRVSFRRSNQSAPETLDVQIPKGVCEGQKIRLAGKGANGGDLLLKISVASSERYQLEGSDIVCDVLVPVWEAVLGGEAQVVTPDGSIRLKIPPGTQPGRRFRLPERGLFKRDKQRADFFVQIKVAVPEHLTDAQRKHWEALAKADHKKE